MNNYENEQLRAVLVLGAIAGTIAGHDVLRQIPIQPTNIPSLTLANLVVGPWVFYLFLMIAATLNDVFSTALCGMFRKLAMFCLLLGVYLGLSFLACVAVGVMLSLAFPPVTFVRVLPAVLFGGFILSFGAAFYQALCPR